MQVTNGLSLLGTHNYYQTDRLTTSNHSGLLRRD